MIEDGISINLAWHEHGVGREKHQIFYNQVDQR
jgi:hypothetical protein